MMPLPGRHLTSVLLRREGDLFLFDCGEGTQVSLRRLNLRWKKISVIFISHTHADHVTGLPGILMLSSQVDRDEPLYIIGPPNIRNYVQASRSILNMHINYEIIVKEIDAPGMVFEADGYCVSAFQLEHSRICYGYVFQEDERPGVFFPDKARELGIPEGPLWSKLQNGSTVNMEDGRIVTPDKVVGPPRHGRKFSYITDTVYQDSIGAEANGSDLLICEGMFTNDLEESAKEKRHLTAAQAAQIAVQAGNIGKLGLIHYSPRYSSYDLKRLLDEARPIFPETFLTRDRQVIPLPFSED